MNTLATTTNGADDPVDWKVILLCLLCGGCSTIVYYNYEVAVGGFTDAQLAYLLVASSLIVAGLAILRGIYLVWEARQPVQANALVLRDDLFAFRDKDSGLWGLVSSKDGVIAEAQFKDILQGNPNQDADYIEVVVEDGRTNVFSISQRNTLLPEEYGWIGHLNDSYHVVTDPSGDTTKRGLYCSTKEALVVPIEFSNFKKVKEDHAVFFEENPHADRFDTEFYGLYSLELQAVVVPTSLEYHRIKVKSEGGFDLGKVVGHTGSRLRLLYPVWRDDVYKPEKGYIEANILRRSGMPFNRDFNTPQVTAEEGVLCTYMGVTFLYPEGSRINEVRV